MRVEGGAWQRANAGDDAQQCLAIGTGDRKNEDSQGPRTQWKSSAGVGAPMFRRGSGVVPAEDIQGLS